MGWALQKLALMREEEPLNTRSPTLLTMGCHKKHENRTLRHEGDTLQYSCLPILHRALELKSRKVKCLIILFLLFLY